VRLFQKWWLWTVPPIAKFNAGHFLGNSEDSTGAPRWKSCIQWTRESSLWEGSDPPSLAGLMHREMYPSVKDYERHGIAGCRNA